MRQYWLIVDFEGGAVGGDAPDVALVEFLDALLELVVGEAACLDELSDGLHGQCLGVVSRVRGSARGEIADECVYTSDRVTLDPTKIRRHVNIKPVYF